MFQGEVVHALIVAAGLSRRMAGQDKVFSSLAGVPLLARTVECFLSSPVVDRIIVVLRADALAAGLRLAQERHWPAQMSFCCGGARRQDSVRLGLAQIEGGGWVLIHDGARPLLPPEMIVRGLEAALATGAAIPSLELADTVKEVSSAGRVERTLPRQQLRVAQTPQVFRLELIRRAHQELAESQQEFTDDAALLEALGQPVVTFPGDPRNIKVTTPRDLEEAAAMWADKATATSPAKPMADVRVGFGYDIHRLRAGRRLVLGGVEVPCARGLVGHSDADALAHAVMDALLGAAGLPDIGVHFPPTDPAFRDACSLDLLGRVVQMLGRAGWKARQVSAVVVAERPRLAPHVLQMRANLAGALGLPAESVSIQVTTNEGLGALGRGEGIAAWATALLEPGGDVDFSPSARNVPEQ